MLRALAIAEMIHGHSLDGLLDAGLRNSAFFVSWTHVRGYTAPLFLFAAGFAFAVATLPYMKEYSVLSRALLRRLQRLFYVIFIGYFLHLPFLSLRKTILSVGTQSWHDLLRVDILRCIGVTVLFLQAWQFMRPRREVTWVVIGLLTLSLPILTPWVSNSELVLGLPAVIRYYFMNSNFPLFYYSSFLFLGFLVGYLFYEKKERWLPYALVIALALIVIAQILSHAGITPALRNFMSKGGLILLFTVLLERGEVLWKRMPSAVNFFGRQSLVVYVVHLMIIYGSVLNKGLVSYWGPILSYGELYLFLTWLMTAMVLVTYVWHKLKHEHISVANWVRSTLFWSLVVLFLLRPYYGRSFPEDPVRRGCRRGPRGADHGSAGPGGRSSSAGHLSRVCISEGVLMPRLVSAVIRQRAAATVQKR